MEAHIAEALSQLPAADEADLGERLRLAAAALAAARLEWGELLAAARQRAERRPPARVRRWGEGYDGYGGDEQEEGEEYEGAEELAQRAEDELDALEAVLASLQRSAGGLEAGGFGGAAVQQRYGGEDELPDAEEEFDVALVEALCGRVGRRLRAAPALGVLLLELLLCHMRRMRRTLQAAGDTATAHSMQVRLRALACANGAQPWRQSGLAWAASGGGRWCAESGSQPFLALQ